MAELAADNFDRANAGTLGANWTAIFASFTIASNRADPTSATDNCDLYNAVSPAAAQYCQVTVVSVGDGGPGVRASGSAGSSTMYFADIKSSGSNIQRISGFGFTNIASLSADPAAASVVKIEITGSSITVYDDGVSIGTATDSTHASGTGGMYNFSAAGLYDDWSVGELGAAAAANSNFLMFFGPQPQQ